MFRRRAGTAIKLFLEIITLVKLCRVEILYIDGEYLLVEVREGRIHCNGGGRFLGDRV